MKLIVGLGNLGSKYNNTRHNVGFYVLDKLAQELGIKNFKLSKKHKSLIINNQQSIILAKPVTFMNDSGVAVSSLASYYKVDASDLYVVHDDLDIALGEHKIQKGKGPKDHGGLNSIYEKLGTKDFWHVRVGVEGRKVLQVAQVPRVPQGEKYVLQKFTEEELEVIEDVSEKVVSELQNINLRG